MQTQPVQPDNQVQADVRTDVHDPAASGAEFLEPAEQTAAAPVQTIEEKIRTFNISDDQPSGQSQTAPPAQNPDRKIAKKTYDTQKGSITRLINKFRSDPMLNEEDYTELEQRLFGLANDMGLNFAQYSTLITISAELSDAEEDYRVHYTEAKSVLDNIADCRRTNFIQHFNTCTSLTATTVTTTSVATPTTTTLVAPPDAPPVSVATSIAARTSVAPTVSVATTHVQTSITNKTPLIDGAKGPSLTADGSSRVQSRIPYSATSTSFPVSTYPNVLPISSAAKNVKFSLPSFVAFFQSGHNTDDQANWSHDSYFINGNSSFCVSKCSVSTFCTSTKIASFENLGSDRGTDFLDPRSRRAKKRGNGQQQQQQQRPPPQTQQRQSPPFSDYQKKFEFMERQMAEQKRLLDEALKRKQPSEADLLQKICQELAAEAAARNPGSSQQNVPGPEQTRSSAPHSATQSQHSRNQQADTSHGRVETLPDHGLPPPFYRNWSSNARGSTTYRPRTDDGAQQHRPPPEPSTPHQQSASALAPAPPSASATADATSSRAFGLPSSSDFRHPSTEYAGLAPGSQQYSPPGGTNFREEDYRTSEQRPLFKPERHTFDATPKTEPWTTFRASFDAAVGSRQMPDAQ